ncbi:pyridoxine 5'-phosphate synthase [Puniceicoccales bacterium CK1056]|uniref:Pyridoxine 5'-phosphate synthase n=1 Tax=Oceanipulchritudo coccoides TaxID=2706888 RepID=A0A6B2M2R6_9BACT|nr:pyridoxine 5'-phosphate synthase [Oceanipulchritudo coccoides]NDV62489.1 pyridoxine 5'-phosphate synthase [Oceanipulchritudo coccoides]
MSAEKRIRLGVNIDHAATLRQARYRGYERLRGEMVEPDPVALAIEAEKAGADGITVHPREDGRHIQRGDVLLLKEVLQVPLNMEMACTDEMFEFAVEVCPRTVCLVPEKREEISTEGGLDVLAREAWITKHVGLLLEKGIRTSLFIDPDTVQIEAAKRTGADYIELHSGSFANAYYGDEGEAEAKRLEAGVLMGHQLGLIVNMGHGINYTNIERVRGIPGIHEMNIGHSIISRALFTGIREAVREMKHLMNEEDLA